MLINDFFTPIHFSENVIEPVKDKALEFSAEIRINPEHGIFKGHFPSQPIVPGVTYVEMIKEIMELVFRKKLFLKEASSIKFLAITNPVINADLIFNFRLILKDDNSITSKVSILSDSKIVIKFDGEFSS